MKTPTNTKLPAIKRKISPLVVVLLSLGIIGVAIILYIYFNSPFSPRNLAAEMVRPLEHALVNAGGVKKCEKGDPGFGGDNWEPWYVGVYKLQVGRKEAIEIITRIGKENGYDLKTDKAVDDVGAEINFVDNTSKKNPYGELKDGTLRASGTVNRYGDDHRCGGEPFVTNESQTIVRIGASLPERKK